MPPGTPAGAAGEPGVAVLGPVQLIGEDGIGHPLPRKTAQLLALLLIGNGEVVPRQHLVAQLWGDDPPASAGTMVREHVKRIRDVLGPRHRGLVSGGRDGYALTVPAGSVDGVRFESLLDRAAQLRLDGEPGCAAAVCEEALSLWRGSHALADARDLLPVEAEAARLDERRSLAEIALVECHLQRGAAADALPRARALSLRRPDRERHWTLLMITEALLGRRAEASDSYRRAHRSFRDALGLDLSPEVDAVHHAVLRGATADELLASAGLATLDRQAATIRQPARTGRMTAVAPVQDARS